MSSMSQRSDYSASLRDDVGEDVEIHDTKDPEEVYLTNRSKIKLALFEYENAVKARTNWVQPVILLLTAVPVLLAADFSNSFIVSGSTWKFVYGGAVFASILWLGAVLRRLYINWGNAEIEYVINELSR